MDKTQHAWSGFYLYRITGAQKYLVIIAGPTGIGKTSLGIELAQHYQSEIISADSRQFYRQLSIGTAKPTDEERRAVPHHFIDTKNVNELYGSGHFAHDVITLADELFKKHDVLFMVGGSGLYIDAVLRGLDDFEEVPADLREKLNQELREHGLEWIRRQVEELDPDFYKTVDHHNPQRLVRALEVIRHTGRPFSEFRQGGKVARNFRTVGILLNMDRASLYRRIDDRVDKMMERGLLEEVRSLAKQKELNALRTVGYKELYLYLEGKTDLATAVSKIKQHTRNYAKRQLTWFRNRSDFREFSPDKKSEIINHINREMTGG